MLTVRFLSEINQPFTSHSTLHDMSTLHKKLYLVTADVTENPFFPRCIVKATIADDSSLGMKENSLYCLKTVKLTMFLIIV